MYFVEDAIIFSIPSERFRMHEKHPWRQKSQDTEKITQRIRNHFSSTLREEKECYDLTRNRNMNGTTTKIESYKLCKQDFTILMLDELTFTSASSTRQVYKKKKRKEELVRDWNDDDVH